MEYLYHILVLISIYAIVAVSFDLLAGQAGVVSVMAVAGAFSIFVSLSSLRVRGDYFVIATFGFQIVAVSVFNNWVPVTQGPFGIPGIPQVAIFGWIADSEGKFLLLAAFLALIV